MIKNIIEYNKTFAADGRGSQYATSKYPDRNLAIVTCMDTRLIEMLPAALGIKNGDAKNHKRRRRYDCTSFRLRGSKPAHRNL